MVMAVDVVSVSEWLSLGARCPGVGAGGRRCLARLMACGVESGVVRPVWRALEHVPGCDRAHAWGDGPGAAGWWCIEGADAGRWVVSTADALGVELSGAWGRHLGQQVGPACPRGRVAVVRRLAGVGGRPGWRPST